MKINLKINIIYKFIIYIFFILLTSVNGMCNAEKNNNIKAVFKKYSSNYLIYINKEDFLLILDYVFLPMS